MASVLSGWLGVSAVPVASPSIAQVAPVAAPLDAADADARIAEAVERGRRLIAYDRAAWVASDALVATRPVIAAGGAGGYVVEPTGDASLRVTFYRGDAATGQAIFAADTRGGAVTTAAALPSGTPLTSAQRALARARAVAAGVAARERLAPCTSGPFNSVVFPVDARGTIAVYLLSPQESLAALPVGGTFRVLVDGEGKAIATRAYSKGCMMVPVPSNAGRRPIGFGVTHLLDPVPTEAHVFAAHALGIPLFVATPDGRNWRVDEEGIKPVRAP